MTDAPRRRSPFVAMLVVGVLLVGLMGGVTYLALSDSAEPAAPAMESSEVAEPAGAGARALASQTPVLPRMPRTDSRDDDAPDPETEKVEEGVKRRLGKRFAPRESGGDEPPTRVQEYPTGSAWPPRADFVGPPVLGRPERRSALAHRRPARDETGASTLIVRVFGAEDGKPLDEARVELRHGTAPIGGGPRVDELHFEHGRASSQTVSPGEIDIRVFSPGRVPVHETALRAAIGHDLVLDVFMERGQALEGVLYGPGWLRASGVRIRVWPAAQWWAAMPLHDAPVTLLETTTDEDGRWRLDSAPRLTELIWEAAGDGFATLRKAVSTGIAIDSPVRVNTGVGKGAAVEGRITDPLGRPLAGVSVFVAREPAVIPWENARLTRLTAEEKAELVLFHRVLRGAVDYERLDWTAERTVTDAEGRYRLAGLLDRKLHQAFAQAGGHGLTEPSERFVAGALDEWSGQLRGVSSGAVHVTSETAEPLEGAKVDLPWALGEPKVPETSEGDYGPVPVDVGPSVIRVRHPAHPTSMFAGRVKAAIEETHLIEMRAGHTVTGTVLGRKDRPIAGAVVTTADRRAVTDTTGRFELHGIAEGEARLDVSAPGYQSGWRKEQVPGDRVEIWLGEWATIRMQLVLPEGAPTPPWVAAGAEDRWGDPLRSALDSQKTRDGDIPQSEPTHAGFTTDWNDGRLELLVAPSQTRALVTVNVPGYSYVIRHVACNPGETVDEGNVRLVPAPRLRGIVLTPSKRPAAGVWVALRHERTSRPLATFPDIETTTDANGRFELPIPAEMPLELEVTGPGYAPLVRDVGIADTEDEIVIDLAAEHVVEGRVIRPNGKGAAGAVVEGDGVAVFADDEGRFRLAIDTVPFRLLAAASGGDARRLVGERTLAEFPAEGQVIEIRVELE